MMRDDVVRIGILRLTDSAPVVMAEQEGFLAAEGIAADIHVEPSWANISDKLTYGHLDAAIMLPPLALAMALGLRGARSPVVVPMGLSLNGNSITVSQAISGELLATGPTAAMETGRRLRHWLRQSGKRIRLGVVHAFSTHNLLLRYWLAAQDIDVNCDTEITVVPPADTAQALREGRIDGFCAGAPWGAVAAEEGVGRSVCLTSAIWRDHPEKCLAVTAALANERPELLDRLIAALIRSARYCDDPAHAEHVAHTLARPDYLGLPPQLVRLSLPSKDAKPSRPDVDRSLFWGSKVLVPSRPHAIWFLAQMARWGYVPAGIDAQAIIHSVFRPDLLVGPAKRQNLTLPTGGAAVLDGFCDGAVFKPEIRLRAL